MNLPTLTPQNIAQPLPDITAIGAAPVALSCSGWQSLNGAIAQHPIVAVTVVAAVAILIWHTGKRGRR